MNNNTTPHMPAKPVVEPAKDDSAVAHKPEHKAAPVTHAPKKDAPAVVPTPKI